MWMYSRFLHPEINAGTKTYSDSRRHSETSSLADSRSCFQMRSEKVIKAPCSLSLLPVETIKPAACCVYAASCEMSRQFHTNALRSEDGSSCERGERSVSERLCELYRELDLTPRLYPPLTFYSERKLTWSCRLLQTSGAPQCIVQTASTSEHEGGSPGNLRTHR